MLCSADLFGRLACTSKTNAGTYGTEVARWFYTQRAQSVFFPEALLLMEVAVTITVAYMAFFIGAAGLLWQKLGPETV